MKVSKWLSMHFCLAQTPVELGENGMGRPQNTFLFLLHALNLVIQVEVSCMIYSLSPADLIALQILQFITEKIPEYFNY